MSDSDSHRLINSVQGVAGGVLTLARMVQRRRASDRNSPAPSIVAEVLRQHPPLAARRQHIEQGVHHRSQLRLARASERLSRRQQRLDQRPLSSVVSLAYFRPSRRYFGRVISVRRISLSPSRSQPDTITTGSNHSTLFRPRS